MASNSSGSPIADRESQAERHMTLGSSKAKARISNSPELPLPIFTDQRARESHLVTGLPRWPQPVAGGFNAPPAAPPKNNGNVAEANI
jgi:hypothetical protein